MKRHHFFAGMLLGTVLLAPQQCLAEMSEDPIVEVAMASSALPTNSEQVSTLESAETSTAPSTHRNLADCSYTPDETFAVTDAICH